MAKKRKAAKKHHFSAQNIGTAAPAAATATATAPAAGRPAGAAAPVADTLSVVANTTGTVVRRDVALLLILAAGFTAILIALWLIFTHTGVGSTVYNAVKF